MLRTFTIETSDADELALAYCHLKDRVAFAFESNLQGVINSARAEMLQAEKVRAHNAGEVIPSTEDAIILNAKVADADARNAEALARFAAEQAEREAAAKRGPLTARQLRLGLVNNGFSPAQVEAAIEALPEGADKEKARIEWQYAGELNRDHPLLMMIAAQLGISAELFDTMWTEALTL